MRKKITSTLIAFAVTLVWIILMIRVMYAAAGRVANTDNLGHIPYGLIYCTILNLMCICTLPTLFIWIYERFNKDDISPFKYIFAAIFSAVSTFFSYYLIGIMATTAHLYKRSVIIVIIISVIFPTAFIRLRGHYTNIGSEKAVKIKNKINASSTANFTSVLAMTLSMIVYYMLPGTEDFSEGIYRPIREISPVVPNVLCSVTAVVGGIVFLSAYESRSEGKGVIKYIQWLFSQFIVLLFIFNLMDANYFIDFPANARRAALFTAFSLIPVIICLISELRNKSITKSIVAGIRKLLKKPQGDMVKAEKISEIKKLAKSLLGGKIFAGGWLMMMLAEIIYGALNGFATFTLIGGNLCPDLSLTAWQKPK